MTWRRLFWLIAAVCSIVGVVAVFRDGLGASGYWFALAVFAVQNGHIDYLEEQVAALRAREKTIDELRAEALAYDFSDPDEWKAR